MKKIKALFSISCPIVAAFFLTQCGGGGGGGGANEQTLRPKSMEGVSLTLDSNITFEFITSLSSGRALNDGDVETGTFIYRPGGNRFRKYPNISNTLTNSDWPERVTNASYSYRAINQDSGVLTLNGVASGGRVTIPGGQLEQNDSLASFFRFTSPIFEQNVTTQVVIDITFSAEGSIVRSNDVTVRLPESPRPDLDTMRMNSTIRLTSGGGVPVNYDPLLDPDRPSRIVPESLDNKLLTATNGIPNPSLDFSLQFTKESGGIGFVQGSEIGRVILRVVTSPIDSAADYTWERIPGTDAGTLTLSNSDSFFDGAYTLNFFGSDTGEYIGDTAQTSGTFRIAPAP